MHCSLFVPADHVPGRLRSLAYPPIENQAVAGELAGFNLIWLADQWVSAPPRLPESFGLVQRLTAATERVNLGVIVRLPPAALHPQIHAELVRLDQLANGHLRVAFDLRGIQPADITDALSLLDRLVEARSTQTSPLLARRLLLVADDTTAAMARARGLGLLLAPGDSLHARRLWLARYHDARGARPGWVTRLLSVAVGHDHDAVDRLSRGLPPAHPLISPATEPTLIGVPEQVAAQLAGWALADGLDEVIAAVAPGFPRPDVIPDTIDLLGRAVLPLLQSAPTPRKPTHRRTEQ